MAMTLFEEIIQAQQTLEEEFGGDPIKDYTEDFIKLLDMPQHSSMEDVYNYVRQLVEETKKLVNEINKYKSQS